MPDGAPNFNNATQLMLTFHLDDTKKKSVEVWKLNVWNYLSDPKVTKYTNITVGVRSVCVCVCAHGDVAHYSMSLPTV